MDPQSIAQIITGLGVAGILGWFLWYDTTKRQPEQRAHYEKIVNKILVDNRDTTREQQDRYEKIVGAILEEHKAERLSMACELKQVIAHCQETTGKFAAWFREGGDVE